MVQLYETNLSEPLPHSRSERTIGTARPYRPTRYEWRHLHWNAIASAYGSSPFFEYYQDDIRPFFEKRYEFLLDFNEEIRRTICNLIGIEPHIEYSSSYSEPAPGETDLRDAIHPKRRKAETILPVQPKPYYQVFSEKYGFQPDLSIIDLLMNMGPESILILQNT